MSCNYAEGLSDYDNKGVCGLPEQHDEPDSIESKIEELAKLIKESKHVVVHTGAGISTSAGIPDFRGPNGVWTLEKQGAKPKISISFEEAVPTFTHMALVSLVNAGFVHYVVNQNVDGLSIRSGFPPNRLSELHGNMFIVKCNWCLRLFIHNLPSSTVGQKLCGSNCPLPKKNGRHCRGQICDTILDWEDGLPETDLEFADKHSRGADLSICLGTTLQIVPSGNLPLLTKKNGGKIAICNLQKTKHDKHANIIIHDYVDNVMKKLLELLNVPITPYSKKLDPTKHGELYVELNQKKVPFPLPSVQKAPAKKRKYPPQNIAPPNETVKVKEEKMETNDQKDLILDQSKEVLSDILQKIDLFEL